ncbi:HAMP domain-containing histidine kinase [Shewanella sp. KX20019]|uniref:ATP-binding protein n=1 Tax=Shewanella sp. KX20019 TaxID=2803864 RepID=UPI00192644AA|nr:HAMP domain-containing sensor histidine kinase [Shewanella sp. KX20019]QQX80742.1 HAMP domain-containing histidine kinase [Shewanella sp. KX20019]
MKNLFNSHLGATDQLAFLRFAGLLLKLGLIFFAAETFALSLSSPLLYWGMCFEALYLAFTFKLREPIARMESGLFIVLLLDTLFWISWLYFTGGATNAFISLLLLPIAFAAITLPKWAPWTLTLLSTVAYSLMIFSVPESQMKHHGMDMSSHYLGMWFNFLISSLVLTTSVAYIAQRMRKQDVELGFMREAQLRQEKLLALGTASAQMAHQLATPLASLRLLVDEAVEEAQEHGHNDSPVLSEMNGALQRCEQTLHSLRTATESIREQKQSIVTANTLLQTLQQQVLLLMPQVKLELTLLDVETINQHASTSVLSDASLLPAMMSLVENAASASLAETGDPRVTVSAVIAAEGQRLCVSVRDYGSGISKQMRAQVGHQLIQSEQGMGMALLLSHASFERLGGRLLLGSIASGGTVAEVSFPLHADIEASNGELS